MKFPTLVSQLGKPKTVAEALAGMPSKDIARRFGVSIRTAQRWRAGTQQPGRRQGGPQGVLRRLDTPARRRHAAAAAIRDAQGAAAGRMRVADKSPKRRARTKPSYRNVGTVTFNDPLSRERLRAAADAVERADWARAEELLSEAVLGTPGRDYGSALTVDDWPAGFHLI